MHYTALDLLYIRSIKVGLMPGFGATDTISAGDDHDTAALR